MASTTTAAVAAAVATGHVQSQCSTVGQQQVVALVRPLFIFDRKNNHHNMEKEEEE